MMKQETPLRLFKHHASERPDDIVITMPPVTITYKEVESRAVRMTSYLRELGVEPTNTVGVMASTPDCFLVAALAVWGVGAVLVPMGADNPPSRMGDILARAKAVLLLVQQPSDAVRLKSYISVRIEQIDDKCGENAIEDFFEAGPEEPAWIMYRSGANESPNGLLMSHSYLCPTSFGGEAAIYSHDIFACVFNVDHELSVLSLVRAIAGGCRIVALRGDELSRMTTLVPLMREQISVMMIAAEDAIILVQEFPWYIKRLRLLLATGGSNQFTEMLANLGQEEWRNIIVALDNHDISSSLLLPLDRNSGNVDIGYVASGSEIYLLDEYLAPTPDGIWGEIAIGGLTLTLGLQYESGNTADIYRPNPYSSSPGMRLLRTGQLARKRPNERLELGPRLDGKLRRKGQILDVREVEARVEAMEGVLEARILEVEQSEPNGLICFMARNSDTGLDPECISHFLRERVPSSIVPDCYLQVPALPKTLDGSVDDRAIMQWFRGHAEAESSGVRDFPSATEERVLALFRTALKSDTITCRDNFFTLGGHSLLAMQVLVKLNELFVTDLTVRDFIEQATALGLAAKISRATTVNAEDRPRIPSLSTRRGQFPLSFAQQRLWFLQELEPGASTYNIPFRLHLDGYVDQAALQWSVDKILERQEALRTRFGSIRGVPFQEVLEAATVKLAYVDISGMDVVDQDAEVTRLSRTFQLLPFDLTSAPLIRLMLISRHSQHLILAGAIHHIISDGWSSQIVIRELTHFYRVYVDSNYKIELPTLQKQYIDYSEWQRVWVENGKLVQQEEYWKAQLAGVMPLELFGRSARLEKADRALGDHRFEIHQPLIARLKAVAGENHATLFMVLLTAVQIVLGIHSGKSDVCVGVPIAGRNIPDTEGIVGFFVNTIVLRTHLGGNPTLISLLRRVVTTVLDAYANQDIPFDIVVKKLRPERGHLGSPFFNVMLVFQSAGSVNLVIPGVNVSLVGEVGTQAKADILVQLEEGEDLLAGRVEYDTSLFTDQEVQKMTQRLKLILGYIAFDGALHLSDLEVLDEADHTLLDHVNNKATKYDSLCLHHVVERQSRTNAHKVAILLGSEHLTYRSLNEKANQIARYLLGEGVECEDKIGISLPRSINQMIMLLAISKVGAVSVPLDKTYPANRLRYMMKDAGMKIVVGDQADLMEITQSSCKMLLIDEVAREASAEQASDLELEVLPSNLLYLLYTSGSTGAPKGVTMEHRSIVNLLRWHSSNDTEVKSLRTLQFASLNFDVSFQEIFSTWSEGGVLVLVDELNRAEPASLMRVINEQMVDRLFVPFVALQEIVSYLAREPIPECSLRRVITAGEQLKVTATMRRVFGELQIRLENQYGPTETHVATSFTLSGSAESWPALPPIGKPISNLCVYVLDANLNRVPPGVPGSLYLAGVGLARGYHNKPAMTAERFLPNPFSGEGGARMYSTGDWVRQLNNGNLEFLGRVDRQVKIRGKRVEPGEIEAALMNNELIDRCAVVLRGHHPHQQLFAYFVPREKDQAVDASVLHEYSSRSLPEHMRPAAYMAVEYLPLLPNGKVDYASLLIVAIESKSGTHVPPADFVESLMTQIWSETLGVADIGMHDDFFERGGHSLLAVRLLSAICDGFGVSIPLNKLMMAPTVAALTKVVRESSPPDDSALVVPIQRRGGEVPVFCVHPVGGNVMCYLPLSRCLGENQPFYGLRAPSGLEMSGAPCIEELAARYSQEIRRVKPRGPYLLAGWSMGGLIAFEMARQLRDAGETIQMVTMFDTVIFEENSSGAASGRRPSLTSFYRNLLEQIDQEPATAERNFDTMSFVEQKTVIQATLINCGIVSAERAYVEIPRLIDMFERNVRAAYEYRPTTVDCDIALFVSEETAQKVNVEASWKRHTTGAVVSHLIHGNHFTMLKPPFVQELADRFSQCLVKQGTLSG